MSAWAVRNSNVIDVIAGTAIRDCVIVIEDARIVYAGSRHTSPFDVSELMCFDGENCWAIPGLVDAHVHLCEEPRPALATHFRSDESDFIAALRVGTNLHTALESGVTTVRDCGSFQGRSLLVKKATSSTPIAAPRITTCGRLLTVPQGHAEHLGKPAASLDEIKRAIEEEVELGADFVKIANYPVAYSVELLRAFVEKAHSLSKLASCHTGDKQSVNLAVDAGFDTIEHAAPYSHAMAETMKSHNVILVPTFYCAFATCADIGQSLISRVELHDVFHPWLRDLESYLPLALEVGVKIAAGTDAGFPPLTFDAIHDEMAHLVRIGASPITALRAATIIGAETCGQASNIGSLEAGKLADIVLLHADPLESIGATKSIAAVILGGRVVVGKLRRAEQGITGDS